MKSKKKGYNPSDYLKVLEDTPPEYSFLRAGKVFNFQNKYPIFLLNHAYEGGTWQTLKNKIEKLEDANICQDLSEKDAENFLTNNPDIDFEICVFDDVMEDSYYFSIKDKIYCYCLQEICENYIMIRFFFNVKEFIC